MSAQRDAIKPNFQTGDFPSQAQFYAWLDTTPFIDEMPGYWFTYLDAVLLTGLDIAGSPNTLPTAADTTMSAIEKLGKMVSNAAVTSGFSSTQGLLTYTTSGGAITNAAMAASENVYLRVSASTSVKFGDQTDLGTYATIWLLPTATAKSSTNYIASSEGTHVYLNAPSGASGEVRLRIANVSKTIIGNATIWSGIKHFFGDLSTVATANVDTLGSTTSVASFRMRTGVAPTTPNEGDMWYTTATGFAHYSNTRTTRLGPWVGLETTYGALYFHQTPSATNQALSGDDSNTTINGPNAAGYLSLRIANTEVALVRAARVNIIQKLYLGDLSSTPTYNLDVAVSSVGIVATFGGDGSVINIGGVGSAKPNLFIGSYYTNGSSTPTGYISSNGYYNNTAWTRPDTGKNVSTFTVVAGGFFWYSGSSAPGTQIMTIDGSSLKVSTSGFFGGTTSPTAVVDIAAATTAASSLRIRTGTAPTSPNNGDIWYNSTTSFAIYHNRATFIGTLFGDTARNAIYFTAATQSASNFAIGGTDTTTQVNGSTSVSLNVANTSYATMAATQFNILNPTTHGSISVAPLAWVHIVAGTNSIPQIYLATSVAPTAGALVQGAMWFDGTDLFIRQAAITKRCQLI